MFIHSYLYLFVFVAALFCCYEHSGSGIFIYFCIGRLGSKLRYLFHIVAEASVLVHDSCVEVLLEAFTALFFPKITHRLTRAVWHETPPLYLLPKFFTPGTVPNSRIRKSYLKDFDPFSQSVLDLTCAKIYPFTAFLLVGECKVRLFS